MISKHCTLGYHKQNQPHLHFPATYIRTKAKRWKQRANPYARENEDCYIWRPLRTKGTEIWAHQRTFVMMCAKWNILTAMLLMSKVLLAKNIFEVFNGARWRIRSDSMEANPIFTDFWALTDTRHEYTFFLWSHLTVSSARTKTHVNASGSCSSCTEHTAYQHTRITEEHFKQDRRVHICVYSEGMTRFSSLLSDSNLLGSTQCVFLRPCNQIFRGVTSCVVAEFSTQFGRYGFPPCRQGSCPHILSCQISNACATWSNSTQSKRIHRQQGKQPPRLSTHQSVHLESTKVRGAAAQLSQVVPEYAWGDVVVLAHKPMLHVVHKQLHHHPPRANETSVSALISMQGKNLLMQTCCGRYTTPGLITKVAEWSIQQISSNIYSMYCVWGQFVECLDFCGYGLERTRFWESGDSNVQTEIIKYSTFASRMY